MPWMPLKKVMSHKQRGMWDMSRNSWGIFNSGQAPIHPFHSSLITDELINLCRETKLQNVPAGPRKGGKIIAGGASPRMECCTG